MINSNGLLFNDFERGRFHPDSTERSPIKAAGIWLGGVDPGGNLKLAAQMYNEDGKQDFVAGSALNLVGDWNQIWSVKREDIVSHYRDYWEDRVIDDTIASIFGWPGYGNEYFKKYNSFELPDNYSLFQKFKDADANLRYDPTKGDLPYASFRHCDEPIPDEIAWYLFHPNIEHTQTPASLPLNMTIQNSVFSFNCVNNRIASNTIFSEYSFYNHEEETIDSFVFSLFIDFELGCPEDDYIATFINTSNESRSLPATIFVYNSDDYDEDCGSHQGYGENPPVAAVRIMRGPLNQFREVAPLASIIPVPFDSIYPNFGSPKEAHEFYNLMTGTWTDGTILTNGGSGYDILSSDQAFFAFPGHPLSDTAWTEINANNPPGHRRVLASFDDIQLEPGAINQIIVAFTFFPVNDFQVGDEYDDIYNVYSNSIGRLIQCETPPSLQCEPVIPFSTNQGGTAPPPMEKKESISIKPNPANSHVLIDFINPPLATKLEIYDMMGRLVFNSSATNNQIDIDVSDWAQGMYYVLAFAGPEMHFSSFVVSK